MCETLHRFHCDIKCSIDDERFIDIRESPVAQSDDEFAWTHAPVSDDVVQVHMIVSTIQMMFIITIET